jgi:hypothetical protein
LGCASQTGLGSLEVESCRPQDCQNANRRKDHLPEHAANLCREAQEAVNAATTGCTQCPLSTPIKHSAFAHPGTCRPGPPASRGDARLARGANVGRLNGLPQIRSEWATHRLYGVYAAPEFGNRRGMQNQPNAAGPGGLGPPNSPVAQLANPKVVLMAAGVLGLAIDLFVRPLSWVALALIVLATAPWILQAWSQRSGPAAKRGLAPAPAKAAVAVEPAGKPRPEQRIVPSGQRAVAAPAEDSAVAARATPRAPPADPQARKPSMAARAADGEPRAAAPRPVQAGTHPPASPEAPAVRRPVRPETAG